MTPIAITVVLAAVATVTAAAADPAAVRIERTTIAGGGELLTIIQTTPGGQMPLLSALRDNLADADRDLCHSFPGQGAF